jgi:hypothetical protein
MTEELDIALRRCAICDRADLPSYAFVAGLSTCCFQCLTALAAHELQRLQPNQDIK